MNGHLKRTIEIQVNILKRPTRMMLVTPKLNLVFFASYAVINEF